MLLKKQVPFIKAQQKPFALKYRIMRHEMRFILRICILGGLIMEKVIDINETIKKAAKEAIKEYENEKAFNNTKLLFTYYNDLKLYLDNADFTEKMVNKNLRAEDYIDELKKSNMKTLIMVLHMDKAMEALENKERELNSVEKYNAFYNKYIKKHTYEQIADDLNCGIVTARRWVNEMLKELSIYMFGVEGIFN